MYAAWGTFSNLPHSVFWLLLNEWCTELAHSTCYQQGWLWSWVSLFLALLNFWSLISTYMKGFPGGSVVKNLPANARDAGHAGSIPGSRRSPGLGNSNPTAIFFPGKSYGQRSLVGYSPWGSKSWSWLSHWACIHALVSGIFFFFLNLKHCISFTFTKISVLFNNALRHRTLHNLLHTKSVSPGRTIKLFVFKACLSLGQNLCDTAQELEAETVSCFS